MIQLKPLLEVQLIKEALPLSLAKQYVSIRQNPTIKRRLDDIMSELAKQEGAKLSKRGDRVVIPFKSDEPILVEPGKDISTELKAFYNELERERKQANHTLHLQNRNSDETPKRFGELVGMGENVIKLVTKLPTDLYGREIKMSKYISTLLAYEQKNITELLTMLAKPHPETGEKGISQGRDKSGNPIWKSLQQLEVEVKKNTQQKFDKLIKMYNEIPEVKTFRENKVKSYYIVFSKHAYDLAGMSTDRGWSSCMNLYGGVNSRFVQQDIAAGSMIAYLVAEDDLNIKKPTARIIIKPFVNIDNRNDVFYQPETTVYGTAPAAFKRQVYTTMDAIQPGKDGTFELIDTLYCDGKSRVTKFGDPNVVEKVNKLIQNRQQATTVDEAKYMLYQYCFDGNSYNMKSLKFQESDKLYVTAYPGSHLNIRVNTILDYCPVAVDICSAFTITNPIDYNSFPISTYRMDIEQLNSKNFTGMNTVIKEVLRVYDGDITSFEGLQPFPSFDRIQVETLRTRSMIVRSFKGIPASVNKLIVPHKEGSETQLHMTLDNLIADLKPVGLRDVTLPLNAADLYSYALKGTRVETNDMLTNSILKKIDSIPSWDQDGVERLGGSRYYRLLGWISRQLPTVIHWHEKGLGHMGPRDIRSLPDWAYPENW